MDITTERLILRPWKQDDPDEAKALYRYASDPEIGPLCGWMPHANVQESAETIKDIFTGPKNFAITLRNSTGKGNNYNTALATTIGSTEVAGNAASANMLVDAVPEPEHTSATAEPIGCIELKPTGAGNHATVLVQEALEAHQLNAGVDEEEIHNLLEHSGNDLVLGYWIGRPFWGHGLMTEALEALLELAFGKDGLGANAVWGGHYVENIGSGKVMEHCGMRAVCRKKDDYFRQIDEYHDCVLRVVTRDEWQQQASHQ